jgi:hypothetical protein
MLHPIEDIVRKHGPKINHVLNNHLHVKAFQWMLMKRILGALECLVELSPRYMQRGPDSGQNFDNYWNKHDNRGFVL